MVKRQLRVVATPSLAIQKKMIPNSFFFYVELFILWNLRLRLGAKLNVPWILWSKTNFAIFFYRFDVYETDGAYFG